MDDLLAHSTPQIPDVGDVVRVVITGRYVLAGIVVYALRVLKPW